MSTQMFHMANFVPNSRCGDDAPPAGAIRRRMPPPQRRSFTRKTDMERLASLSQRKGSAPPLHIAASETICVLAGMRGKA